jgi:hypothetical protein
LIRAAVSRDRRKLFFSVNAQSARERAEDVKEFARLHRMIERAVSVDRYAKRS